MKPIKTFLSQRSVRVTLAIWAVGNITALLLARGVLPFDRPVYSDKSMYLQLVFGNVALLEVFLLMAVVRFLTRKRTLPNIALRAPSSKQATKEIIGLVVYGVIIQIIGALIGLVLGWHPISFHLAGTLYGATAELVTPIEATGWMLYNFTFYAVIPYLYFRFKKQYTNEQLSLHSNNIPSDLIVIIIIVVLEALFEIAGFGLEVGKLSLHQLALGAPLTFGLYFLGTVLPTMIFAYSILLPRYLKLTQSVVTTTILGGVTYTLLHFFDAWTIYSSPYNSVLSIIFLFLTYFGPGMFKSVLTLRTANAWVHVWAYHAFVPHLLDDTPLIVKVFKIK